MNHREALLILDLPSTNCVYIKSMERHSVVREREATNSATQNSFILVSPLWSIFFEQNNCLVLYCKALNLIQMPLFHFGLIPKILELSTRSQSLVSFTAWS